MFTMNDSPLLDFLCRFHTDTDAELQLIREHALRAGAHDARVCEHWARGGEGAVELGEAVVAACAAPSQFKVS